MSDPFLLFLLLVLPVIVAAILTYLGILVIGLGPIVAVYRSAPAYLKGLLIFAGLLVILSPALFHAGMDLRAERQADQRLAQIAQLDRTDLTGRLPRHYIAVGGGFSSQLHAFVEQRFGLRRFPATEDKRLSEAYRSWRRAERCHRINPGNPMVEGTRLPVCKRLPDSLQSALGLREPILVFADGHATSMLEDNTLAGEVYEIRLITPQEDLLVAYFEERTAKGTPSVFNPYASGRRKASTEPPPALKAFIETSMEAASR